MQQIDTQTSISNFLNEFIFFIFLKDYIIINWNKKGVSTLLGYEAFYPTDHPRKHHCFYSTFPLASHPTQIFFLCFFFQGISYFIYFLYFKHFHLISTSLLFSFTLICQLPSSSPTLTAFSDILASFHILLNYTNVDQPFLIITLISKNK